MVFRFKDFGFFLTAIIGLGLAGAQNVATEYARIDGGFDDYTRKPIRQFTITGNFQDASHLQLRADRGTLASYLDRDLASLDQQLVLRHHLEDQCGNIQSDAVLLPCKYVQGLEGNVGSYYGETVPLSFVQYLPVIQAEGEAGAALAVQATVTNANNLLRRSPSGTWSAMSTGTSGGVNLINAILQHPNGYVYVGGDFLSAGSSGADYMARYDPATDTFANIAGSDTTFNGAIYALCRHQDGRIVVAGTFTNAAANPSADAIVTLDPTANTISALGTGANAVVLSCAVDNSGRIFGGANFATDFGAIANSNGIAYWDGAAWNAMGTGLGSGNAYAILPLGNRIYIGGDFGSVSGVANTAKIAYWDFGDSAWHSVTSGTFTGTSIFALAKLPNGNILIVGSFSVIGGVSAANVAIYNGVSFTPIGSGINGSGVWGTIDPISGTAWVSGNASTTTADGITIASPYAKVVGGALRGIDVDLPGTPNGLALAFGSDGTQYLGYDTTGSATVPGTTTVTNTGTARSYPVITIKGPSSGTARIYQITNYTTGRAIYLNLTISAGETVVMNFRPDALSFTSDFVPSGNVAGTILPGSNEADFFLQPGANVISFFSASSSVTATIRWRPAFASLDGVQ